MAKKKLKKVLLIEPNYKNKFPPIGLMKLATYYKNLGGWEVVFYKGDLKKFVIERIVNKLVERLNEADTAKTDWHLYKHILFDYIRTRKIEYYYKLEEPLKKSEVGEILLSTFIIEAKDYYWKGTWEKEPEWDRVGITTLFTFYWDITVETINFAKKLAKHPNDPIGFLVGGVLASIQPKELEAATGIKPYVGILNKPGQLDEGDTQIIDELELDYSILDEIDYTYSMSNAYYRYTTKGCIRNCPFCAVKTLEPIFKSYVPLKPKVERVNSLYGSQKDLLLMDNNVLASKDFEKIINEIIDSGFGKDALWVMPNILEISIRNLKNGINDRAYIRKTWSLIDSFYQKLKGDESYLVYCVRRKYHIENLLTSKKENLISAYGEIEELYTNYYNKHKGKGKKRYVDFNQGLDARLFTQEKANLLTKICINPVRIAFDNLQIQDKYITAIEMCVKAGLNKFSNYLLYNFTDIPDDLYYRLRINVDLCEQYNIDIYSFPMKYHPLRKTDDMDKDYSHNRDYIGKHWNRKYIRVIQAVLNSTKGMVGRGRTFFYKAFGKNLEEFHKLLEMPEDLIIYRFFYEWLSTEVAHQAAKRIFGNDDVCKLSTNYWWELYQKCQKELDVQEWNKLTNYIHNNDFNLVVDDTYSPLAKELLIYYIDSRKDILKEGTELYLMKLEYDKNPTYISFLEKKHQQENRI